MKLQCVIYQWICLNSQRAVETNGKLLEIFLFSFRNFGQKPKILAENQKNIQNNNEA